ncbi:MAG: endolytic transglycosylase MltG [Gemmatimonadaceae bacterium]|nr:endolytic transglycosylase MltG [Gemmatimonadaceae bacterium]
MRSLRPSCCNTRSAWRRDLRRVGTAAGAAVLLACGGTGVPHGPYARVTIPPGTSFRAAADSLHRAGFVAFPVAFRLYARVTGRDRDIKAGTYVLERDLGWNAIVDALRKGQGIERKITIPEGWSLREIVPALAHALGTSEDSVNAAVRDTALLHDLDVPTPTLEGYLFPDTYIFSYATSARTAVREMVRRFKEQWQPQWDDRLQQLAMSRHDIVTLASIIEKEARLPEERPVISAVYHNRLRAQMPLQADPTVQYALGEHHDRLLYKDLEVQSPYNTYRNRGLPPGPIASPGRASIEAALYPASVPYLYFVADSDGHHEFRTTFKEHTEAKAEVRRNHHR